MVSQVNSEEESPSFRTIVPEPKWDVLLNDLIGSRGKVMIIGATDSGKSTLVRYLLAKMVHAKIETCLVDSDVGQSLLCLPGTISMKLFRNAKDTEDFICKRMTFVGTVNPAKSIPLVINAVKRLAGLCMEATDMTLFDTSGLIAGEPGRALKTGKIRAVHPETVIAVQAKDELEHILRLIKTPKIYRIRPSRSVMMRGMTTRSLYRKKKLDDYFRKNGLSDFLLHEHEVQLFYHGRLIRSIQGTVKEGALIGLNHDEDTLALGILDDISADSIVFRTTLKSIRNINRVIFGDMTID